MSLIKTAGEIEALREGGQILGHILKLLAEQVRPGVTTHFLDELARSEIEKAGAKPAFLGYKISQDTIPYPAALCASIDNEVVHCIPNKNRHLEEGQIIGLDLGVKYKGLYTDSALTIGVGKISSEAIRLIETTKLALQKGIGQAIPGKRIGDVAFAIEQIGRAERFGVITDLTGHGVGHAVHESPSVPNYGKPDTMEKLVPGMVLAIEPMFTTGTHLVRFMDDGWGVETADGSLAAHFEHTIAITDKGNIVLTKAAH